MASQYDDWDDDDDQDAGQESNPLRDLRKANRAKERQIKELTERLEQMQKAVRERSVKDVLEARGLNPKIAKFIPESVVDADAVAAWVEENGDVFGGVPQQADTEVSGQQQESPELAALQRISQVQSSGAPFQNDPDQLASLIKNAATPEDLNKVLFGSTAGPNAF